jgi:mRNA interferase MazF
MNQGEIWLVHFMPQVGTEITKTRPAVLVSDNNISFLPTRLVVPLRDFKSHHLGQSFFVPIHPNTANGLTKNSTADCSQVKSFDTRRFVHQLGIISASELEEILDGIDLCLGR